MIKIADLNTAKAGQAFGFIMQGDIEVKLNEDRKTDKYPHFKVYCNGHEVCGLWKETKKDGEVYLKGGCLGFQVLVFKAKEGEGYSMLLDKPKPRPQQDIAAQDDGIPF